MPAELGFGVKVKGTTLGRPHELRIVDGRGDQVAHDLPTNAIEGVCPQCGHFLFLAGFENELAHDRAVVAVEHIGAANFGDEAVDGRVRLVDDVLGLHPPQERGVEAITDDRLRVHRRRRLSDGPLGLDLGARRAPHARGVETADEENERDENKPEQMLHY